MGLAPWQKLESMCVRAFCVSKFEVGGPSSLVVPPDVRPSGGVGLTSDA